MKAVSYLRVSSKGQAGDSKDGYPRQRRVIAEYADQAGVTLLAEYADAYTGTDSDRPEFARMVGDILKNGCRAIVVESLDRLARGVAVQDTLVIYLASQGITLLSAVTGEDVTAAYLGDPMKRALIQIQGVFAELEKNKLVSRLKHSRRAKRTATGRCEGVKPYGSQPGESEIVELMRRLRRKSPVGERMPYQGIADSLNDGGIPTRYGGPWRWSTVRGILARKV